MSSVFTKILSPKPMYLSDEELLRNAYLGDSAAWGIIYEKISPVLFMACLRYASGREQAEDFLQEGFIKAYNSIHTFRGNSSLQTWITRVVINTAINELKKQNRFKTEDWNESFSEFTEEEYLDDPGFNLDNVTEAMQQLPAGYRTVLNMYAIDNMSHAEIAETLGISINTSKTQLFKARKNLIAILNQNNDKQK